MVRSFSLYKDFPDDLYEDKLFKGGETMYRMLLCPFMQTMVLHWWCRPAFGVVVCSLLLRQIAWSEDPQLPNFTRRVKASSITPLDASFVGMLPMQMIMASFSSLMSSCLPSRIPFRHRHSTVEMKQQPTLYPAELVLANPSSERRHYDEIVFVGAFVP